MITRRLAARLFLLLLLATVVSSGSASAQSARLAQGLNELVTLYQLDNPKLASVMKRHLTTTDDDVLVDIQLQPGASAAEALSVLALEGFRLESISTLDPSLIEGYLPLWAARSAVWTDGLATIQAVQRPLRYAGAVTEPGGRVSESRSGARARHHRQGDPGRRAVRQLRHLRAVLDARRR